MIALQRSVLYLTILTVLMLAVPVGASSTISSSEPVYRVRDNGTRCIVAPCFSRDLIPVDPTQVIAVSAIDLSQLKLSPEQEMELTAALATGSKYVRGSIRRTKVPPTGAEGATLMVTEVFDHRPN
jgi:hypothetical protein